MTEEMDLFDDLSEYVEREAVLNILASKNAPWDGYQKVSELPAVDVRPAKWIPVTERLPEEYEDVLCYYEYFRYGDYNCMFRAIDRGYYGDGRWGGEAGQGRKNKVLAWMPLPEPPKDGET